VFKREALKLRPMTFDANLAEILMRRFFKGRAPREARELREELYRIQAGRRFIAILARPGNFS
jgi:hypothetical protein